MKQSRRSRCGTSILSLLLFSLALAFLLPGLLGFALPAMADDSPAPAEWETDIIAQELLLLMNNARTGVEVPPLENHEALMWAAQLRAAELAEKFSHTRPNGSAYSSVFDAVGFAMAGRWHGENIVTVRVTLPQTGGETEAVIAAALYAALRASSGQTGNLLRGQYALTGVGVTLRQAASEAEGTNAVTVCAVQLFASA